MRTRPTTPTFARLLRAVAAVKDKQSKDFEALKKRARKLTALIKKERAEHARTLEERDRGTLGDSVLAKSGPAGEGGGAASPPATPSSGGSSPKPPSTPDDEDPVVALRNLRTKHQKVPVVWIGGCLP